MTEYLTVPLDTVSATSAGFRSELDEMLNAQAELGWHLRQILQVRANHFLVVFEKHD